MQLGGGGGVQSADRGMELPEETTISDSVELLGLRLLHGLQVLPVDAAPQPLPPARRTLQNSGAM